MNRAAGKDLSNPHNGCGHVLIVEDDPTTARALERVLQQAGYRATVCLNGSTALHSAGIDGAVAAVVDVHLPDFNGLVLTGMLRQRLGQNVPVIVLSGDTSMETLNTLPHVGAAYFLSKPVSAPVLLSKLADCIAQARAR